MGEMSLRLLNQDYTRAAITAFRKRKLNFDHILGTGTGMRESNRVQCSHHTRLPGLLVAHVASKADLLSRQTRNFIGKQGVGIDDGVATIKLHPCLPICLQNGDLVVAVQYILCKVRDIRLMTPTPHVARGVNQTRPKAQRRSHEPVARESIALNVVVVVLDGQSVAFKPFDVFIELGAELVTIKFDKDANARCGRLTYIIVAFVLCELVRISAVKRRLDPHTRRLHHIAAPEHVEITPDGVEAERSCVSAWLRDRPRKVPVKTR